MFGPDFVQRLALAGPAILFSLTVHEFFHAWSAHKFGDNTARDMGRLTLNPMAHLDLFGTIAMVATGFQFGWAKPVPVNPLKLRNPRWADLWISAAGPLSNFGLALIFGLVFQYLPYLNPNLPEAVWAFLKFAVVINVSLAFFNLIPLFPLDGSHILRNLLPAEYAPAMAKLDAIAPILLIGLLVFGAFGKILGPFISFFAGLFLGY